MATDIIVTDEFKIWFDDLNELEQEAVARVVGLLEDRGVTLEFPFSTGIRYMRRCGSCGFSKTGNLTGCSTLSIQYVRPFFWSAE
jgi:hypothetical protein